ncbi:UDPglucose 6-dehydrogenase [Pullulanibacillus pueri]|uniref:UDP-glucose 6-dehydrogenase n=1 Tax=Pullulanibacillus pueri TaxID=1437324 RepID=A0A8J3EMP1_9BACL|nr:UDP-glucose/GDP-mannose dehydrogenase family protein [Pullulanibacillus pueri]MBM7681776.1 UDPglucose 6-dehydrogenase [Pullulanibacillus pueri]GGH84209.1 UDP-glucose 6-dehydrogenase YwqF [Pullulanibacillus pueri]
MKIAVIGTGYVGLVTGVCLSDIGHTVICIDVDQEKVKRLQSGDPIIYEPGLEDLMKKNIEKSRLSFSGNHQTGLAGAEVVYIAVGTPQNHDGSANLNYIEAAATDIAKNITQDTVVVTKSTVPVGTNQHIKEVITVNLVHPVKVTVVSNPEFLREGSAIQDTFSGDRIVIGTDDEQAAYIIEEINQPFGIPVYKTDIASAEMIKYASNAFLATKISFINEIANICEKTGANVDAVAAGMGLDNRIGPKFLSAGLGYGGSCFPKDTNALVQLAGNHEHDFKLLKSVIEVNNNQPLHLFQKAKQRLGDFKGKKIAVLGLAFKPNTDDMREAPSTLLIQQLLEEGANVTAFDPIAIENARRILGDGLTYSESIDETLQDAEATFIVTDWEKVKNIDLATLEQRMKYPIVFDGRNCFALEAVKTANIEYYSMGRSDIANREKLAVGGSNK